MPGSPPMSVSSRVQHAVLPRPAGAPDSAGRDAPGESGRAVCGVHPRCAPARDHGAVVAVRRGGAGRAAPGARPGVAAPPATRYGAHELPARGPLIGRLSALAFAMQRSTARPHDESRESARQVRAPEAEVLARLDHRRPGHRPGRAAAQPARGDPGGQRHRRAVLSPAVSGVLRGPRAGGTAGAGAGPSGVAGSGDRAGRTRCSTRWVGVSACRSCRRRAGRRRRRWRRR